MGLTQISTAGVKDDAVTAGKIPANAVGNSELADDAVGIAELSATGTASNTTFLRGDNSWTTVNTDLVGDTSPQLGGNLDTNGNNIAFDDNYKANFGDDTDLSIFHTSGFNQIQSNNSSPIQLRDANNVMLRADPGGAVDLRHNASVKLATTSTGVTITGNVFPSANDSHALGGSSARWQELNISDVIDVSDNGKLRIGDSDDLQIYHDAGAASHINATGLLNIDGTTGVRLEYNNATRLETTSAGATVTGDLTTGQLFIGDGGPGATDDNICIGDGKDLKIYHDGNSVLYDNGTGNFKLYSNGGAIQLQKDTGENMALFNTDGNVELYYDNVKKFETQSSGTLTTGDLTSNLASGTAGQGQLNLGSSGAPLIRGFDTGNHGSGSKIEIISGDGDDHIVCKRNGAVELFHDGVKVVETKDLSSNNDTGEVGLKFAQNKAIQFQSNQSGIATASFSMNANTWTTMFSHDSYVAVTIHMSSVHNAGFSSATWIMSKSASGGSSLVRTGHNNAYSPANLETRIDGSNFQIRSSYGTYGYLICMVQYNMDGLNNIST